MDSLPLCNLLQVRWGALCTRNEGSECKGQATVLHCRKSGATFLLHLGNHFCSKGLSWPAASPAAFQDTSPPVNTGTWFTQLRTSEASSQISEKKQSKRLTQRQESKVHLQKVKQAHYRREDLSEQIAEYWQDTDANSNKADRGKRRWAVKLATTDFTSFGETATPAFALGNTQLEQPSPIQAHTPPCPRKQSHSILIPSSRKPLTGIQPKDDPTMIYCHFRSPVFSIKVIFLVHDYILTHGT